MPRHRIPLIVVKVPVEHKSFDPDAVDMRVYCINSGETLLHVNLKGESFITIDEVEGTAAGDSSVTEFTLEPGAVQLIAEIEGWEWDGHVGMEIGFRSVGTEKNTVGSYDFKTSAGDYFIEALKLQGRIVKPL